MEERRPRTKRYPPELKERAVKMVQELRAQDPRDKTVISRVARQLGIADAKMRVTGIGIFDGQKKTLLKSSDGDAEVPVIKKRKAQVVSVGDKTAQLMDSRPSRSTR